MVCKLCGYNTRWSNDKVHREKYFKHKWGEDSNSDTSTFVLTPSSVLSCALLGSCSLDPSITTEGSRQFSDLVKMDPCFIFNHAKLSPICHVYSVAQRMNRRPAHYLDV